MLILLLIDYFNRLLSHFLVRDCCNTVVLKNPTLPLPLKYKSSLCGNFNLILSSTMCAFFNKSEAYYKAQTFGITL